MCLCSDKKPKFKTAKKPIVVYKWLIARERCYKGWNNYRTPWYYSVVPKNGIMVPRRKIPISKILKESKAGRGYAIRGGVIHAYRNKAEALQYTSNPFKAIIPKGAKYFSHYGEVVTTKLKLIKNGDLTKCS